MVWYSMEAAVVQKLTLVWWWYGMVPVPLYVVKLPPIVCLSSAKE